MEVRVQQKVELLDKRYLSLKQLAQFVNSGQLKTRETRKSVEKRQMQIIDYFERALKKQNFAVMDLNLS